MRGRRKVMRFLNDKKKIKQQTEKKQPKLFTLNSDLFFFSFADCLLYFGEPAVPSKLMRTQGFLTKKPCVHFGRPREPATFCFPSAPFPTPVWPTPPPHRPTSLPPLAILNVKIKHAGPQLMAAYIKLSITHCLVPSPCVWPLIVQFSQASSSPS